MSNTAVRDPQMVPAMVRLSTSTAGRTPGTRPRPVSGITCSVLAGAAREVEHALLPPATPSERELLATVIAAVTLAVGHGTPDYVVDRCAEWPPAVVPRVLQLFRAALLRAWREGAAHQSAYRVLSYLAAAEAVHEGVEHVGQKQFTTSLNGPEGADALAEVLHDLRSPLSAILFLSERVEQGKSGEVNALQRRQVRLIEIAALQLSMLANDAIDAIHDRGLRDGDRSETLSIIGLLKAVADVVRPIAEEKNLELRFVRAERDCRVGLRAPLLRVLLNLVTNALKFTHQGSVEVTAVERGDTRVEFSVRDTGAGISPDAAAQLYQPFHRAVTGPIRRFSRTGLGLGLCRRLVEQLGGMLRHESPPGGGTRFWFEVDLPPITQPLRSSQDS